VLQQHVTQDSKTLAMLPTLLRDPSFLLTVSQQPRFGWLATTSVWWITKP
jgi:hypothetical protein